jgi:mannose-6-phosphate isomerase class I
LFTFGLKEGVALEDYKTALRKIDTLMKKLSVSVKSGAIDIETARAEAKAEIAKIDPYQYVNIVEADEDDVIDLTPGGIHHSWEEDDSKFPQGNLVYEVQVDVADEYCSMRGFDKGKLLADGGLRATHVEDYLTTIERYSEGKKLSDLIGKPKLLTEKEGAKEEAIFRTPYFELDRVTLKAGSVWNEPAETGFHHLFVQKGSAKVGETILAQGQSFIVPAVTGVYKIESAEGVTILKTSLPLE